MLTRDLIGKNIFTDCPPGKVLPDFCGSSGESLWGSGEAGADPQPFAAALWGWAEPRSPVLPCWGKLVLCSRPGAQIQLGHCCCHPTAPGLCTALQALWFLPNGEQQKGSEEKTSVFSPRWAAPGGIMHECSCSSAWSLPSAGFQQQPAPC